VIGPVSAFLFLAACPAAQPDSDSLGPAQVAHLPPQEAMNLNREGKALYRDGHFAESRAKYQRAKELDLDFLAPWLNLACAYAREDRFAEATEQAVTLIRHAYVPGAREVMEAADLGALQIRPQELAKLKSALAQAAKEWSQAAQPGFLFVGRTQPPVKLQGQGILVLAMNQEIYAWLPRSGRFLPLTAEDGRVLAFVKSPDGHRIVFVRAGRLVRGAGQADLLRGLSVRQLDLASMALGPVIELPGDVRQLTLWPAARDSVELDVAGTVGVSSKYQFDGEKLQPAQTIHRRFSASVHPVVLTAAGVAPTSRVVSDAGCSFSAHDEISGNGLPGIRISARAGKGFFLDARYGAGLDGLPFPDSVSSPSKGLSPSGKTR